MSNAQCDSEGRPISEHEHPSDTITVWAIEPHLDKSYDCCIVRDYHDAVEHAQHTVEMLMDDPDNEEIVVKIRRQKMLLHDYMELGFDE